MIVVLAGLGEREALRVLADHDADAHVRATACRYVAQTAPLGYDETNWLVARLAHDVAEPVVLAVVELAGDTPAIDALLEHPTHAIREALVSRYERFGAPASVIARARVEPDLALRVRLARLALVHDPSLLRELDLATAHALLSGETPLPLAAIFAFASRALLPADDAEHALALLESEPTAPPALLLGLANRGWTSPAQIERVLDRCASTAPDEELRHELTVCRARLAPRLEVDPDDSYPPSAQARASVQHVLDRIDALLMLA